MRPLAASERCGSAVYAQRMLNEALTKASKKRSHRRSCASLIDNDEEPMVKGRLWK